MKTSKKSAIVSLFACSALCLGLGFGLFDIGTRTNAVAADGRADVSHYFYNQLNTDLQRSFYHAMEDMHENGIFIAGEDLDLVENNYVTQEELETYAYGSSELLDAMGAARDAFYTDYADIFYVDFSYLSLRVTQAIDGYHAYLGSGRADTYYLPGFESKDDVVKAIEQYDKAINDLVAKAKAAQPKPEQVKAFGEELATTIAPISEAHKQIALSTVYRLEDNCSDGNEGHIRTPYGLLIKGEALCEGYSRTFKAAMDRLGYPCVLVNGVYRHSETREELHMWTHVQLEVNGNFEWYAVDQTFDDLNLKNSVSGVPYTDELGKAYSENYFLKGAGYMNMQHVTSPYKSEVEYPFTYPKLAEHNFGSEVSTAHRDGIFEVKQSPYNLSDPSSTIEVSVYIEDGNGGGEWCGYVKAAQKGYYIVMRHEGHYLPEQILRASEGDLSDPNYDLEKAAYNLTMVWAYLSPFKENPDGTIESLYDSIHESESGDRTIIEDVYKPTGFEFALTDMAPLPLGDSGDVDEISRMTTYFGDPTTFIARTGLIKTLYGDPTYVPAPHIVKASPVLTGKLAIGYTYNVTAEYDQWLELMDGEEEIKMSVVGMRATGEILRGTNAIVLEDVVDLSTLTWDPGEGNRMGSISFTFTPSPMYAHDNVLYYFNFNIQGVNSGKQVNPITHVGAYESDACCYKANGFHWRVWAQPQLLENDDLSTEGWVTSDGTDVSQTSSRLALVVTSPSKKQESQMNDLLEDALGLTHEESGKDGNLGAEAFQSFTYNISLTICKGVVLETGQGIRVSIGFPEGFTYDSAMEGVTFKAYHFGRDGQNNVDKVDELEVTVTELGLIITCYSFSPFAIVAVKTADLPEDARPQPTTNKTVITSASTGGTAYATIGGKKSNLFTLKEGETQTVAITAQNGYYIDTVKVNGKLVEISAATSNQELTLSYAELTAQTIVEVAFVPQKVQQAEHARGESTVVQQLHKAVITVPNTISATTGQALVIEPTIKAYGTVNRYQWYKDGVKLEGQNEEVLSIGSAEAADAGEYTLVVTSTSGGSTVTAESNTVTVSVNPAGSGLSALAMTILIISGVVIGIALLALVIMCVKRRHN